MMAFAVPAKRVTRTVRLTDGTTITAVLRGDETYHFLTTLDGTPLIHEGDSIFRIAPEMGESISSQWAARCKARNTHRIAKAARVSASNNKRKAFGYPSHYTGMKHGIVLLVNYQDATIKQSHTNDVFEQMFNLRGYNKNNHIGSVRDYFLDASYSQLDIEFDVYGPVTLSHPMAYYGKNDSDGNDMRPAEMAAEAVTIANSSFDIDWKLYDWDDDGCVDQVFMIYAGYGEASGAPSETIWPHEWSLSEGKDMNDGPGPLTIGDVTIDTYAVSNELSGTKGSSLEGIGIACHEFSHCLGLPDMYDTSYGGGYGMNAWDLMDQGSYSGPSLYEGQVPCGYTAYERWFAGWLDFIELSDACTITDMPSLNDNPVAYIIYNDANRNEYFILENRQNHGFYSYLHTHSNVHGMLVTHVDYDEEAWTNNAPNSSANHQRMSIVPAGGRFGSAYSSHVFPGSDDVVELTNDSHYSCGGKLFNKNTDGSKHINKFIRNIREENGLISFDFSTKESEEASDILAVTPDTDEQWFTLGGTRISRPSAPGIYLVRRGDTVRRMLIGR